MARKVLVISIPLVAALAGSYFVYRAWIQRRVEARHAEMRAKLGPKADGKPEIVVSKSQRTLRLLLDGEEVFRTRIGLGGNPSGHKEREGDSRTPEGTYYVCTRNDRSRFHLFLGLSYPGTADAERGLRDGLIDRRQHDRIVSAQREGRQPLWNTKLGGEVGIHGHGAGRDWTAGCIALENEDIELLWGFCPIGTPVRIEP